MSISRFRLPFILCTLTILVSSCTVRNELLHILTDTSDLAAAAEIYSVTKEHSEEGKNVIVIVRQVPTIDAQVLERSNADLIIGKNLRTPEILAGLAPIEIDSDQFGPLRGPQDKKQRSLTIPLAYELPLLMAKTSVMDGLSDPSTISVEELRSVSAPYAKRDKNDRLTRVGFSPSWNPASYSDLLAIRSPTAIPSNVENADDTLLRNVASEAREWIDEGAGSVDLDREFSKRYRYMPDVKLIEDGRILFARTDFESWAKLPDTISSQLDLRYLSGPRAIPVPDITSAAIPRGSKAKKEALLFTEWLLRTDTQTLLIERWEQDGLAVFGFLGGLSTNQRVNETVVLKHFPSMKGMIPETHYLAAPELLPHRWERIRTEVVATWFAEAVVNPETAPSLAVQYQKWDLSSLSETE